MERAIGEMEALFRMVRERVARIPEGQRKKVLYLAASPPSVSGAVGVTNEMITLIGARNAASVVRQRNIDVPLERIIAWNPDVIVIWGNARYDASDLTNDPQWRLIPAVRKGQVYKAPEWSTWSPRLAPFALWMAAMTYPEYFKDVNMDKVVDDFHRKVFGVSGKAMALACGSRRALLPPDASFSLCDRLLCPLCGAYEMTPLDVLAALFGRLPFVHGLSDTAERGIIIDIRLPRVILAGLVGLILSGSGRNPPGAFPEPPRRSVYSRRFRGRGAGVRPLDRLFPSSPHTAHGVCLRHRGRDTCLLDGADPR